MKKILFPTDFSKTSLNAFVYALHLAKKLHAEILTLHLYLPPGDTYADMYGYIYANYEIDDLGEFENFKSEVPKLRNIAEKEHLGKIQMHHMLRQDDAVEGILSVAKEEDADYIVMGTNGASGITGALFGSTTEKVINSAHIPVLAIPSGCDYQDPHKLLFLTQYHESEVKIMDAVIGIASHFKAHIDVLEIRKRHKNNEAKMLKQWKGQYIENDIDFSVLINDDVETTVANFIAKRKTDIVVMMVKHKGFFEKLFLYSLSRNLAFHSAIPVLSIPVEMVEGNTAHGSKANTGSRPMANKNNHR